MPASITPQQFVQKWQNTQLKESAAAQQHFLDLCRLIGHPTPAQVDHKGEFFTFEAGATLAGHDLAPFEVLDQPGGANQAGCSKVDKVTN